MKNPIISESKASFWFKIVSYVIMRTYEIINVKKEFKGPFKS